MQNRGSQAAKSLGAIGVWSLALLCGSLAACSGTIDTPTDEFPARQGGSNSAADDDDATPARTPAAQTASNANSSSNDDDDADAPAASNDNDAPVDEDPPADDAADPPADDAADPPAGDISFASDVQPIFNTTCGPCHAEAATAGVNIGDSDIDAAYESAVDREEGVFRRIEAGTMPPGCSGGAPGDSGCISEEDLATIEAWYEAGSPP